MTKEVDALILIGHSNRIAADLYDYVYEDTEAGMYYLRENKTHWYDGAPITNSEKMNIYASEIFLHLGQLATAIYQKDDTREFMQNPFRASVVEELSALSPFTGDEKLHLPVSNNVRLMKEGSNGLPIAFDAAIEQAPVIEDELYTKWEIAKGVHVRRGSVAMMGMSLDELATGIGSLDLSAMAPDVAEFDSNGNAIVQGYDMGGLVERANIESRMMDFPYYTTFDHMTNAAEMLETALEDLRLVASEIK